VPLRAVDDARFVLRPGRLTLLLGPPSCGKSSLLRLLAGRLDGAPNLRVSGDVWYNGHAPAEFDVQASVALAEQLDAHLGNLTVQETLHFAHRCQAAPGRGPGGADDEPSIGGDDHTVEAPAGSSAPGGLLALLKTPAGAVQASALLGGPTIPPHLSDADGAPVAEAESGAPPAGAWQGGGGGGGGPLPPLPTDREALAALLHRVWEGPLKPELVMRLMGLSHVRHMAVGDAMTRGVSGGERKRLTTAEMLMGAQRLLLLDEISTGLDSATLYSVITYLASARVRAAPPPPLPLLAPRCARPPRQRARAAPKN